MRIVAILTSSMAVALTGCSLATTATPSPESGMAIRGVVHGGQQPIVGAHIYMMQAGTSGSAGNGIAASSNNTSISLLSAATTGLSDAIGAYVQTDSNGNFSLPSGYTCTPGTQVYLYSLGGNPGAGTNSAAGLLAILGNCPAANNFDAALSFAWINEATTVAAAFAMAGYATDATHVSSSGSALAKTGIQNAFANAANLVDLATGAARTSNVANSATVPQKLIYTLSNILASCVNSSSPASTPCTTLMANATSDGAQPSETATAAINIAHNPSANIGALYTMPPPAIAFAPALTVQPNDFSLSITYTFSSLVGAEAVAIDASGNAWVASNTTGAITKLSPSGASLASFTGSIATPTGIAIDTSGNAWVASVDAIVKLNPANTAATYYTSSPVLNDTFFGIAIDGTGNIWSADSYSYTRSALDRVSSGGSFFSSTGYTGAGLSTPVRVAVDGDGNVWATNALAATVSKLASSGTSASGSTGFTGIGVTTGNGIAIDSAGSAWIANSTDSVTKLANSGAILSGTTGFTGGGIASPQAIAIDGAGNAWVAGLTSVAELSSTGTALTGSTGLTSAALKNALAIAIDGSGNLWVADFQGASGVKELIGAAVPVITPTVAGLPSIPNLSGASNLGTRP